VYRENGSIMFITVLLYYKMITTSSYLFQEQNVGL